MLYSLVYSMKQRRIIQLQQQRLVNEETSENGDKDEEDFSEYRKSLRTYADVQFKNSGGPTTLSPPLSKQPTNQSHLTGDFHMSNKKSLQINQDNIIDETY